MITEFSDENELKEKTLKNIKINNTALILKLKCEV